MTALLLSPSVASGAAAIAAPDRRCLSGVADRAAGALLGKMCGDVLGAAVEGWNSFRMQDQFPNGLVDFQRTSRGCESVPAKHCAASLARAPPRSA